MTDSEKIAHLQGMLEQPEGKYSHAQIKAKLQTLQTHQPGEGLQQPGMGSHESDPPSQGDQDLASFNERIGHFGSGVKALGSAAIHPIDTATNPAKRREMLRGVDDMVTLGYGQQGSDALVRAIRKRANYPGQADVMGPTMAETAEADAAAAPGYRAGGQIPGMFSPGATSYIAREGGAVAKKALGRVPTPGPASGAGMGTARSLLGYEVSAPLIGGLHASSEGHRFEAAKAAATDPFGLIVSGTLGTAGGAGRGQAAKIRNPNTESGRILADVQAAGGKVKKFGEPVEGGLYETPELKNLPEGRVGTNQLAEQSTNRILAANRSRLAQARAQFGDTVDEVIMSHGEKPHPTSNSHRALDAMEAENTVNGVVGDDGVHSAIGKVRRMLTQGGGAVDQEATVANAMKAMGYPPGVRLTPPARQAILKSVLENADDPRIVRASAQQITAGDMVKARKLVRKLANNAADPSGNRVYQIVLGAMDEDAAMIDPRIKQMNAQFSKAMEPIEQTNDMLFGKARKDVDFTEAERNTAVGRMGRIGDDTQAATTRRLDDRLAAVTPENAAEVRLMRAKKGQEKLRRGEPETSTAIEKTLKRPGGYSRTVAGTLLGGPIGTMIGYGLDKYAENPLANKVRLGLPASEAVGKMTGEIGVGVDAVTRLARKRGKKKKEERPTP